MTDIIAPATPLPCPFCGGDAHTTYIRDGRRVVCVKCSALGAACHHGPLDKPSADERAIAAWNTRTANCHHELVEALADVAASLAAAISLLERGGKAAKNAAPSDKMFDQMLRDYKASLKRARAILAKAQGGAQ